MDIGRSADPVPGPAGQVLADNGVANGLLNRENVKPLFARDFYPEIQKRSPELFLHGNYFYAVFEAAKV